MMDRRIAAVTLSLLLVIGTGRAADGAGPPKKVLVELYTSQGCDSCPPASDFFGQLAALGLGPDRIVPIGFHVDYFNNPWVDPFSDASYSRREQSYNGVLKRDDLYFTPMMMVDGRVPMLGSDRPKALAAIRETLKEPAGVALEVALEGDGPRKTVSVVVTPRSPAVAGRDLMVGVALTQDRTSTRVASGENAGKALVEHHVVRSFAHEFTRLDGRDARKLTFPVTIPPGAPVEGCRVSVYVQDRYNGKVYQAESVPWSKPKPTKTSARSPSMSIERLDDLRMLVARRRARRDAGAADWPALVAPWPSSSQGPPDDPPPTCPDCGVPLDGPSLVLTGRRVSTLPTVAC